MDKFILELFNNQDLKYLDFNAKLIPTLDKEKMIGVRIPVIKKLGSSWWKNNNIECLEFLNQLPHKYYEENNLHAYFLSRIKDYDLLIKYTKDFIPYINNWATCDFKVNKLFKKYPEKTRELIKECLASKKEYTIRYGIGLLLNCFLDENFLESDLDLVGLINSDYYYVKMMQAWYFSYVLIKYYDLGVTYLKSNKLSPWVQNKTIEKARDSYQISFERKKELQNLKVKK